MKKYKERIKFPLVSWSREISKVCVGSARKISCAGSKKPNFRKNYDLAINCIDSPLAPLELKMAGNRVHLPFHLVDNRSMVFMMLGKVNHKMHDFWSQSLKEL